MRKSRSTEPKIVKVLKEVEGGGQVMEVCREYVISDATQYTGRPNTAAWNCPISGD
jgi:putative transposase